MWQIGWASHVPFGLVSSHRDGLYTRAALLGRDLHLRTHVRGRDGLRADGGRNGCPGVEATEASSGSTPHAGPTASALRSLTGKASTPSESGVVMRIIKPRRNSVERSGTARTTCASRVSNEFTTSSHRPITRRQADPRRSGSRSGSPRARRAGSAGRSPPSARCARNRGLPG
jgi:hypothetical protein